MHTCTHKHMCTCMQIHVHTHIRTYIHTYIHTYVRTYIHTCRHACIHMKHNKYLNIYIYIFTRACLGIYTHKSLYVCVYTYIYIYIYRQIRMHACRRMHVMDDPLLALCRPSVLVRSMDPRTGAIPFVRPKRPGSGTRPESSHICGQFGFGAAFSEGHFAFQSDQVMRTA